MKNKHILFVILALGIIALLAFVFIGKNEEAAPVIIKKATEAPTVSNGPATLPKAVVLSDGGTAPSVILTSGVTTGVVMARKSF